MNSQTLKQKSDLMQSHFEYFFKVMLIGLEYTRSFLFIVWATNSE